ncbi:MAG: type II secretion system F family protein [Actinomycetota bacterium]
MTAALLVGLGFGAGLLLVVSGIRPAPVPLGRALADLNRRPRASSPDPTAQGLPLATRLFGQPLLRTEPGRRLTGRVAADLHLVGITPAEHLVQCVLCAFIGLAWAPVMTALLSIGGASVSITLPLWCSVALAPAGFLYPSLNLRARAAARRRTFRHALSAFLDIVAVSLAGGRGVESALNDAADAGQGWAFADLRRALLQARLLGEAPWDGLGRLGEELGVAELSELAASAGLAGSEGARVRTSLAAKAKAMRQRSLSDVEGAAQAANERMSLPIMLLMLGFVVLLGFPSLMQVLQNL